MIEFAVVMPLILIVVVGLIVFPLSSFFTKITLTDAAREAARHVAIHYEDGNAEQYAEELIELILDTNGLDPERIEEIYIDEYGDHVFVGIEYENPDLYLEAIGEEAGTLYASSAFRKEYYEEDD